MNKKFINRTWELTEEDDFFENVAPVLDYGNSPNVVAVPAWGPTSKLVGWFIQGRYE
jgi:hypothetical protein